MHTPNVGIVATKFAVVGIAPSDQESGGGKARQLATSIHRILKT